MTRRRFVELLEQNATDIERVSPDVAEQQLATAAALRDLLNAQGGAILGDEVGSGKTYVTFAVLAEVLLSDPNKGAAIFVPKEILQRKWARQLQEYLLVSLRDRKAGAQLAKRILTVDRTLRGDGFIGPKGKRPGRRSIVITRHDDLLLHDGRRGPRAVLGPLARTPVSSASAAAELALQTMRCPSQLGKRGLG